MGITAHEFFNGNVGLDQHFLSEVCLGEGLDNTSIYRALGCIRVQILKTGMTAGSPMKLSQVSVSATVHLVGYLGSTYLSLS